MSLTPSKMFCTMLEQQFNIIVETIESLLTLPSFALSRLKSNFKRIFDVLYAAISASVDIIEEQLISVLQLDDVDQNSTKLELNYYLMKIVVF
jgi:hypothetical protein